MSFVTWQLLCVFCFLTSPALSFPEEEGETEGERGRGGDATVQMMNPPLDCIISGWMRPVGQSQVLESS